MPRETYCVNKYNWFRPSAIPWKVRGWWILFSWCALLLVGFLAGVRPVTLLRLSGGTCRLAQQQRELEAGKSSTAERQLAKIRLWKGSTAAERDVGRCYISKSLIFWKGLLHFLVWVMLSCQFYSRERFISNTDYFLVNCYFLSKGQYLCKRLWLKSLLGSEAHYYSLFVVFDLFPAVRQFCVASARNCREVQNTNTMQKVYFFNYYAHMPK